ncbi:MAG TPA: efflux RND transporter periplasmic adaptor subunit [Terriglobales bacterium]|nr:efflux RND transporter periplasmic adaptor subunit [Terriglobales bacterium]
MRKTALIAGGVLLTLVVALLVWRGSSRTSPQSEEKHDPDQVEITPEAQKNAGVVIVTSAEQKIQQMVKTTAVVSADESRVAHIFPLSQGIVEDVNVQLGDRVQKGQPLLVYDNIELGESLGEYQNLVGGLSKASAQEQVAKKSLDRANNLIEVEAISPREFELRKAEYEQSQAEVESRRAEVARAEEKLHRFGMTDEDLKKISGTLHGSHRTASHATIRAPFSGVVTKYDVSRGEVVGRDKELFTVVDTTMVWALADVYEKDIRYVARGGDCLVALDSYPGQVFKGKITYLSDALDPASRTAKLRCVLANENGQLKLEMFGSVSVPTRESRTGVSIPISALQEVNGEQMVFVQTDASKFTKRSVQTGQRDEQNVEITSGIKPGEKVVANGSFYLKSALLRELIGGEE